MLTYVHLMIQAKDLAILLRYGVCLDVWTPPSFPFIELGTFSLFKLPTLLWETYY